MNSDEQQLQLIKKNPNLFYLDREAKDILLELAITASTQGPRPVSTTQIGTDVSEVETLGGEGHTVQIEKSVSITMQTEEEDEDEVDLA